MQTNLFIERLYQQIEIEMLQNIGTLIGNGEGFTEENIMNWQVEKLGNLGVLRKEQLKVLAKYSGMTIEQMKKYIEERGIAEIKSVDGRLKGVVNYVPPSTLIYDRLLLLESKSVDTMNMINSSMLSGSEQIYRDIITKSTADVIAGNKTLQQAMVQTAKEWAARGVPTITDKLGRQWGTEGYVSTVVRATQKNVATEVQEGRFDEYDIDLVEISSHAGSRPSHIEYQGKIFSRSGKSKKYPSLKETSYGEIDGIVTGINCKHQMYAYIEGVSTKRFEPYDKKESVEEYKQSQKQRYLERQIRRAKKEKAVLQSMKADEGDIQKANELIRKRQASMRSFIKDSGRTRRPSNERVVN